MDGLVAGEEAPPSPLGHAHNKSIFDSVCAFARFVCLVWVGVQRASENEPAFEAALATTLCGMRCWAAEKAKNLA